MRWTRIYPWIVTAALGGCAGEAQVTVASPDLVEVEPGVQVVADADQPLFFVDGGYYMYRDGYWMRSDRYDGGFVRINVVPDLLHQIRSPQAYVHYRRSHSEARVQERREQPSRVREQPRRDQEQRHAQEQRTQQEEQAPRQPAKQRREDERKQDKHDQH